MFFGGLLVISESCAASNSAKAMARSWWEPIKCLLSARSMVFFSSPSSTLASLPSSSSPSPSELVLDR